MPVNIRTGYDVVVVGGGTAGAIAAVAASRSGARTLLVEQYGHVGGMAGTGMFLLGVDDGSGRPAVRGIAQEIFDRLIVQAAGRSHIYDPMFGSITAVDGEMLKATLLDLLDESGAHVLMHTFVTDALVEQECVRGIVVENKSGRLLIPARVVIDASGDADVAARAGAGYLMGREGDQRTQPATLIFRIGNVEIEAVLDYIRAHPEELRVPEGFTGESYTLDFIEQHSAYTLDTFPTLVAQARERGEWDLPRRRVSLYMIKGRRDVTVNATRIHGIDGTNADDLTRAEIELHRQARAVTCFLQKYVPGFEHAYLNSVPHQAGVRETRRIVGEYTLTAEDILSAREFPDAIARGAYPLDIHDVAPDTTEMGRRVDGTNVILMRLDRSYTIPFRCLVPHNFDGLLVAGRCISASHEAAGSIRGMSVCMATGHAAGVAAAMAAGAGVAPRNVDVTTLRARLEEQGAILHRVEAAVPVGDFAHAREGLLEP